MQYSQPMHVSALWRTIPVTAASGDDLHNISKAGSTEPELLVRLYRLES